MTAAAPGALPAAVRVRVIALADEALAALPEQDVPPSLRSIRRFTPAKRARLGAAALGAALDTEPAFRWAVAERVRAGLPAVAAAVDGGAPVAAVPAADVAAVAYVLNVDGWEQRVELARQIGTETDGATTTRSENGTQRASELDAARADLQRLRRELMAARRESAELRHQLGRAESAGRRADREREAAQLQAHEAQVQRAAVERHLAAEARRLRAQVRDAEAGAAAARRGSRTERDISTARVRVLLEAMTAAAAGLRRELDLPGGMARPADLAAGPEPDAGHEPGALLAALRRGRGAEDPAIIDDLLAVPGLHLIIDGYNVTKLGYPALTLEDQRIRLTAALGGLAARTPGAELTCVFDATQAIVRPAAGATPRGLRVLYSAHGELADQLIVRLAEAEPPGRAVVVVTNDRGVIAGAARAGADAVASRALLARLERA